MVKKKMELEVAHAACGNTDKVMISWEFETPLYRVIQEDRSMF
jgi:hypothetical protein